MKVLLTTAVAAGVLVMSAGSASAFFYYPPPPPPPPVEPECDCIPDALDILQTMDASQVATNVIKDFKTVTDVTQSAINVANSVSIDADVDVDLGIVKQTSGSYQLAKNYLEFGAGGYTGEAFDFDEDDNLTNYTQTALNAVNLINVPSLGAVEQESTTWQTALNTAAFDGASYPFGGFNGDVTNLSQSATNVANSVSAEGFFTFDDCECIEISQIASGPQLAANAIIGSGSYNFGSLNGAIQNATNIANSISGSLSDN